MVTTGSPAGKVISLYMWLMREVPVLYAQGAPVALVVIYAAFEPVTTPGIFVPVVVEPITHILAEVVELVFWSKLQVVGELSKPPSFTVGDMMVDCAWPEKAANILPSTKDVFRIHALTFRVFNLLTDRNIRRGLK